MAEMTSEERAREVMAEHHKAMQSKSPDKPCLEVQIAAAIRKAVEAREQEIVKLVDEAFDALDDPPYGTRNRIVFAIEAHKE